MFMASVGMASEKAKHEYFQMPLHYPRYSRGDYKTMPEWKLDHLLGQYGIPLIGGLREKRGFAMGAFLWHGDTDESAAEEKKKTKETRQDHFQMPLHYPRYTKADYEAMPEWKVDHLLAQYGLPVTGGLDEKRRSAMGAFLWPSH